MIRYISLLLLLAGFALPSNATTFFYVVTATDSNGLVSGFSNEATATLIQGMKTGVTLTWTASTPANGATIAGYTIYRETVKGACALNGVSSSCIALNSTLVTGGTSFVDPFVSPSVPSLSVPTVN